VIMRLLASAFRRRAREREQPLSLRPEACRLRPVASRASSRALTLIEVLIVLAIVGIVMGAVVIGSGRTASAELGHGSPG